MFTALALLTACANPKAQDTTDSASPSATLDCDPVVTIPAGLLPGDDGPVPADPHSETYGDAPTPKWVRYMWPARDPSDSAAFLWATGLNTLASQVQIGPAPGFPDGAQTIDGYSFLHGGPSVGEGNRRVHEVRLCHELQANTTYAYRVGGGDHWSDTFEFTTPGAPGSFDSFRVAMSGDSRGATETWGQVLAAMDAHEPDLILFTGDLIDLGADQNEWDAWLEASGDVLARRPIIIAHGNHEFLAQSYFARFAFPQPEEWYAIDYGNTRFIALNDTVRSDEDISVTQTAFLETELQKDDMTWEIPFHHQSAYSSCTVHGSFTKGQKFWAPLYDQYDVKLVVAGHNHTWERSVPIRSGEASADGTTYLVTGGAGAPLYESSDMSWFSAVYQPVEHYAIADFSPESIDVVVRDLAGNVLDEFSITR